ncbi:hypothetical protein LC609_08290 [Nostoc sp. XA013]|nr:hypothetical protein [Nostoc sp. XA013]
MDGFVLGYKLAKTSNSVCQPSLWLKVTGKGLHQCYAHPEQLSAPVKASARAVSTPKPDAAPVMIGCLPERSIPFTTSAEVECRPKGIVGAISSSSLLRFQNVSDRLELQ